MRSFHSDETGFKLFSDHACSRSCSPCSSWVLVLSTVVVFSSLIEFHPRYKETPMQSSTAFFSFLPSLWYSALQILALSSLSGSHLCVGSCPLSCGPEYGFTLKTRELTWCTYHPCLPSLRNHNLVLTLAQHRNTFVSCTLYRYVLFMEGCSNTGFSVMTRSRSELPINFNFPPILPPRNIS